MIPSFYEFYNPVKILSGVKALENIPYELGVQKAKRPIILTNTMLLQLGLTGVVTDILKDNGVEIGAIFEDIPADSSIKVVNETAQVFRSQNCDAIIAIGGGSVIDTAKGLQIVISQDTDGIMKYMGSEILPRGKHVPFVVVPTTAGTGSEATLVAVINNPERRIKMEFISYHLLPDVAVLDPRMTRSLPPRITASTGMDALCHAIEAYTCMQKNPLSDAYAFAAINLIRENLPRAVQNGRDEDARLAMANASLMAGVSFSNSMVGIVHAIGHACGGICHVPHGDAMAVLLPHCMDYNMDKLGNAYGELLLPLAGAEVFASTAQIDRGRQAVAAVRDLNSYLEQVCNQPVRLSQTGVKETDFEAIAQAALNDGAILLNPKQADFEDVIGILEKAF